MLAPEARGAYLMAYETDGAGAWRKEHSELTGGRIVIPASRLTTRARIQTMLRSA